MAYTVILKRSAEKELDHLAAAVHRRIAAKLLLLETNPHPELAAKPRASV